MLFANMKHSKQGFATTSLGVLVPISKSHYLTLFGSLFCCVMSDTQIPGVFASVVVRKNNAD